MIHLIITVVVCTAAFVCLNWQNRRMTNIKARLTRDLGILKRIRERRKDRDLYAVLNWENFVGEVEEK